MTHRLVQYEIDGEERWAIWSTVLDDFVFFDATAEEAIEYEADWRYERAESELSATVERIRNDNRKYKGRLPSDEEIEELKNTYHDDEWVKEHIEGNHE